MRIQLSKNFWLHEFTRSQTAARHGIEIKVEMDSDVYGALKQLCDTVLQPLRDALGPVHITSGYRPEEINRLIGGAQSSQHIKGEAADLVVTGHAPQDVCRWLADSGLPFDQVILEFNQWTHVSIAYGRAPRGTVLTAYRDQDGRVRYVHGIHDTEELAREAA